MTPLGPSGPLLLSHNVAGLYARLGSSEVIRWTTWSIQCWDLELLGTATHKKIVALAEVIESRHFFAAGLCRVSLASFFPLGRSGDQACR